MGCCVNCKEMTYITAYCFGCTWYNDEFHIKPANKKVKDCIWEEHEDQLSSCCFPCLREARKTANRYMREHAEYIKAEKEAALLKAQNIRI